MNVGFERTANTTDEWYTPRYIIDSLGKFDLDPCAPIVPLYQTAGTMYNELENGLEQNWEGRVWLNPPYSRPLINKFMRRMSEHNHGIALIFFRTDTELFHTEAGAPGCGSVLIAYGEEDANILEVNELE